MPATPLTCPALPPLTQFNNKPPPPSPPQSVFSLSLNPDTAMKNHHQSKMKNPPRPLFSCGIFSYCTQTVLSPTNTQTPSLPPQRSHPPNSPPPPPRPQSESSSSSSSSTSTSQSFTQWRFPIPKSPQPEPDPPKESTSNPSQEPINLAELFHVAEIQLAAGSNDARLSTLHLLDRSLVPNLPSEDSLCPIAVMRGVVSLLKEAAGAKAATKVLLALCLAEGNRHVAVEAGAVNEVVEALAELEGASAERALAALELLCTVAEGAAELRMHALAVPMMVQVMGKMGERGKECALSALLVVFSNFSGAASGKEVAPPAEEVARAVVLAMQGGECSARGKRKGAHLLKMLQENGRLDFTQDDARAEREKSAALPAEYSSPVM